MERSKDKAEDKDRSKMNCTNIRIHNMLKGKFLLICILSLSIFPLSIQVITYPVEAAIIRVPLDYSTIQDAINFAVSGDTVLVAPGTYAENINFLGKAITVTSEGGPEVTIIDGNQAGSVVTFSSGEGQSSVLCGFTLQNGNDNAAPEGGGISIQGSSPTITDNKIINNTGCDGVGIGIGFGSPIIQYNIISNNTRTGCSGGNGGGGILVRGASAAQILDNVISNNVAGDGVGGGGISLFAAGTPTIRGNIISGNTVDTSGGGISLVNFSDALIVQNLIIGNSAGFGGGIAWLVPSGDRGPLLVNNTLADNDSPQGSGIFADGFDAETELINNIMIAKADQAAIFCGDFNDLNPPIFKFNNIYSPSGTAYGGICTDQTGINGNISVDPVFVDSANGNYHVQSGSPVIDAGDNTATKIPDKDIDGDARIFDGDNNGEAAVDIGADEFVAVATNLTATSISESVIKLTWTDNSMDETSFKVYRKIGTGSWSLLKTKGADVVSHTDWTATGNTITTYSYYVQACTNSGCSPRTKAAVVPYRPTNLTATASSSGQIDLAWTDNSSNETGFQIERKNGSCSSTNSWSKIKTASQNITSYSDTGVASGKTYSYRVRAYKKSWATPYAYGYSKYSICSSAKTL